MNDYTNAEKAKMEEEEFNRKVDELNQDELPTANIMVAGITGTGKSTLLNAVFGSELAETGKGRPVTAHINEYQSTDIPIHIWDTVGLELDSEKTKDSINSIRQTIAEKATSKDQFDRVHAIWYCINSGSNRYQGAELNFIKNLYSIGVPFIIVLTQCIGDPDEINEFEKQIRGINISMGMKDIDIVQVCAQDFKLRGFTIEAFGLDVLVDTTLKRLPDFIKGGFVAAQRVSKVQKRVLCEEMGMRTKSWTVEAPKEARVHCSHTKKGFVLCNYTSRHVL
jgi:GTP-binding protein EngB required for normal cell division